MIETKLKSPFVYFGGKSKVADEVWRRFGANNDRYIEPFFGSGAVLLANPYWREMKEIVNDVDHFIVNCWRSIRFAADEVAYWCDYPTIECELHLWHIWLVNEGRKRIAQCEWDENHYDAEVAGKWLYGMANWIGGHFAAGTGFWTRESLKLANELGTYNHCDIELPYLSDNGQGVSRRLPHLFNNGKGVNRRLPHLSDNGKGVNRQLPHLSSNGKDVNRRLPMNEKSNFVHKFFPKNESLYLYLQQLAARFIEVDVCCGDWKRILTPAIAHTGENTKKKGTAAIFFDPPYSAEANRSSVYTCENFSVAQAVRNWCVKHGNNPRIKIALCGYDTEHKELEGHGWGSYSWSANGGYSTFANKSNQSHFNKHRETIWFSPACLPESQANLFVRNNKINQSFSGQV